MMTIGTEISEHFARTWRMFREAIRNFPEDQWRTSDISYLIPARLAYHAFETAEFYSNETPEGFGWGSRFGVDWEDATPEQLPTREQALIYLDEAQAKVGSWLNGMKDSDLSSPNPSFPWTGESVLGRVLYLLRHAQHHLGQLNVELRRRGLPRAKWQ